MYARASYPVKQMSVKIESWNQFDTSTWLEMICKAIQTYWYVLCILKMKVVEDRGVHEHQHSQILPTIDLGKVCMYDQGIKDLKTSKPFPEILSPF